MYQQVCLKWLSGKCQYVLRWADIYYIVLLNPLKDSSKVFQKVSKSIQLYSESPILHLVEKSIDLARDLVSWRSLSSDLFVSQGLKRAVKSKEKSILWVTILGNPTNSELLMSQYLNRSKSKINSTSLQLSNANTCSFTTRFWFYCFGYWLQFLTFLSS